MEWSSRWEQVKGTVIRGLDFGCGCDQHHNSLEVDGGHTSIAFPSSLFLLFSVFFPPFFYLCFYVSYCIVVVSM